MIAALHEPRFGILGNHDFIEQVTDLESLGLPILLNEVASISRGSDQLWIAGIDDPHFYSTHDLATRNYEASAQCLHDSFVPFSRDRS